MFYSPAHPLASLPLNAGRSVETPGTGSDRAGIARLTAGLAAGDEASFCEFHARYFDRLFRFLVVVCRGQHDEAAEALQQTFIRVARYVRQFESEEVFWGWLKALARSSARDGGRKRRRYAALLERLAVRWWRPAPITGPTEDSRLRELVTEALEELPAEERLLITGKYLRGETVHELSALTGLTGKAVEARLFRLRRSLRDSLLQKLRNP